MKTTLIGLALVLGGLLAGCDRAAWGPPYAFVIKIRPPGIPWRDGCRTRSGRTLRRLTSWRRSANASFGRSERGTQTAKSASARRRHGRRAWRTRAACRCGRGATMKTLRIVLIGMALVGFMAGAAEAGERRYRGGLRNSTTPYGYGTTTAIGTSPTFRL
jgi:hypothetical protein